MQSPWCLYRGDKAIINQLRKARRVPIKKEYSSPEFTRVYFQLQDAIMASGPENHSSYIDDDNDDWGDDN